MQNKYPFNIIFIDHFDSFTFNLVDMFQQHTDHVQVVRSNTSLPVLSQLIENTPRAVVVLSPGPGAPKEAETSVQLVRAIYRHIPILGVCLGHQIIAHTFGGEIDYDDAPVHGKSVHIQHSQQGIFEGLPASLQIGRYHSLLVKTVPSDFNATAYYQNKLMAFEHQQHLVYGVQFHPESVLTPLGWRLIQNFVLRCAQYYQPNIKEDTRNHDHKTLCGLYP